MDLSIRSIVLGVSCESRLGLVTGELKNIKDIFRFSLFYGVDLVTYILSRKQFAAISFSLLDQKT